MRTSSPSGPESRPRGAAESGGMEPPPSIVPFPPDIVRDSRRFASSVDYGRLVSTREGNYSALLPFHTPDVVSALGRLFPGLGRRGTHILDATAGVGGDTLNFLHNFPRARVTAVELEEANSEALRRNISACGYGDRCVVVRANVVGLLPSFARALRAGDAEGRGEVDFVYVDPPWGGPHQWKTLPGEAAGGLGLAAPPWVLGAPGGAIPLSVVADQVFALGVARAVVAKVPPNFDLDAFAAELSAGRVAALEPVYKRAPYFGADPPVAYRLLVVKSRPPRGGPGGEPLFPSDNSARRPEAGGSSGSE